MTLLRQLLQKQQDGKGAKPIYINGTASSSSNYTLPAGSYIAYYDGTNYYFRTDGKLTADITGNATHATTATSATSATNASFLSHLTVDNTTLHNTAGTFAFSGSEEPWAGSDWVGLQVGDSLDKFQLTAREHLLFRQNDNGGTNNTGWTDWFTVLDSNNYGSYALPLSGGTLTGDLVIKKSSSISSNSPASLTFITEQTDNNITSSATIKVYDDHDTAAAGTNMII